MPREETTAFAPPNFRPQRPAKRRLIVLCDFLREIKNWKKTVLLFKWRHESVSSWFTKSYVIQSLLHNFYRKFYQEKVEERIIARLSRCSERIVQAQCSQRERVPFQSNYRVWSIYREKSFETPSHGERLAQGTVLSPYQFCAKINSLNLCIL